MYVAVLEDDLRRRQEMQRILAQSCPDHSATFLDNAPDMIDWLQQHLPEVALLCLDHDLGPSRMRDGEPFDPGCGRDVVDHVVAHPPRCPVVIHSSNLYAAPAMVAALQAAGWVVERVVPFSDLEWIRHSWAPAVAAQLEGITEQRG